MRGTKKALSLILIVLVIFSTYSISFASTDLPKAIWALYEQEGKVNQNDLKALIEIKLKIIQLFDTWDDNNENKLKNVAPRYKVIGESYEKLLDYDSAIKYYEKYAYYADLMFKKGLWNQDGYNYAISKIKNLKFDLELYIESPDIENNVFYNAKYEPKSGIYFGSTYDTDTRIGSYEWENVSKFFPKKNSGYLIYLEFGHEIKPFDRFYKAAEKSNTAVKLAWNAYETYEDMSKFDKYIKDTATYLSELQVPVFVRYGSEMNDAEKMGNAKQFVENFRYIATKLREYAPNVAIVWSPNDITASGRNLEEYYPGDEYVDWVGISTYTYYYYGNQVSWGDKQDSLDTNYFTGPYANPLSKIESIIKTYGSKKPIMISESGISHYSKVANKPMNEWALTQLARQYAYMPLKYPQIKGIYYFNVSIGNLTPTNDYALFTNEAMNKKYNELVNDSIYVSNINENSSFRYKQIKKSEISTLIKPEKISFSVYTIVPKMLNPKIEYVLNGKIMFTTTTLPYKYSLITTDLMLGDNSLKINLYDEAGNLIKSNTYSITKTVDNVQIKY